MILSGEFKRLLRRVTFTTHNADDYTRISKASLFPLRGGYSSSNVFKMQCQTAKGETVINSVLKLSPIENARIEIGNYLNYVKWYLPYTWRPEMLSYAYSKNYGMICYSFAYNDEKLFSSMTEKILEKDKSKIEYAIKKIFDDSTKKWYSKNNRAEISEPVNNFYRDFYFKKYPQRVVSEIQDEIKNLISKRQGSYINQKYCLGEKTFPYAKLLFVEDVTQKYITSIIHGDLNTNNIMISEDNEFIFIDFQETGIGHIYHDYIVFEMCLKLYYHNPNMSFDKLIDIETRLANDEDDLNTSDEIVKKMQEVRRAAFINAEEEDKVAYNYGIAMRAFRLLKRNDAHPFKDWQIDALLACLLTNLSCIESNISKRIVNKPIYKKMDTVKIINGNTQTLFTEKITKSLLKDLEADSFSGEPVLLFGGMSGAEVYRVRVQSRNGNNTGSYIVKLMDSANARSIFNEEKAKAQAINSNAPDSFKEHLVDYRYSIEDDSINAIVYKQANKNIQFSRNISEIEVKERIKFSEIISADLLNLWNEGNINNTRQEVSDFFTSLLTDRITVKNGESRFEARVNFVLSERNRKTLYVEGTLFPNPYYYIYNMPNELLIDCSFILGRSHGDFHGRNIICDARHNNYALIDYSHYESNAYLLYDHAYFEIDEYYTRLKDKEMSIWISLIQNLLSKPFDADVIDIEYGEVVGMRNAICHGIYKWASTYRKNDFEGIEKQLAFARIAAGIKQFCLAFIQNPDELRKIYTYIAVCCKSLFEVCGYKWEKNDLTFFK